MTTHTFNRDLRRDSRRDLRRDLRYLVEEQHVDFVQKSRNAKISFYLLSVQSSPLCFVDILDRQRNLKAALDSLLNSARFSTVTDDV